MARRDPDSFGEATLALVFIAGNTREAQSVEAELTTSGIDYCLQAEDFVQGILSAARTGVGFYVLRSDASIVRHVLEKAHLQTGLIDLDPREEPLGLQER
jgi:hypothetical protein